VDDDEFEEYDDIESWSPSRKFQIVDLAVLVLNLVRGLSEAFTHTFTLAQQLVAAHANYRVETEDFRQQAAREIETLTNGE
jgi:hypothetical protein